MFGAVRVATVVTAGVIFAAILWRRRAPLVALVAVMAWLSAYEIAFNALGTVLHGWSLGYLAWLTAALAGWVVLATVKRVVPDWRLAAAAGVIALAWIATTGFAVNSPALTGQGFTSSFSAVAEACNEGSKVVLGLAYLAGGLRAR